MKGKLLVATHKAYSFPTDPLYQPIHVGKALSENDFGFLGDDIDENISLKNRSFCELTALYWAWKNEFFKEDEFCGLVHYRRYFFGTQPFGKFSILSQEDIGKILSEYDVIVPKKRKYYIESVRSHYTNAHYEKDMNTLEAVLTELQPEYTASFKLVMNQRSLHLFNMFIMNTQLFHHYCSWLFPLLFELEKRIDISGYDGYQRRVFGFMSERLFNVWLVQQGCSVKEVGIINLEEENCIAKALKMLRRKYFK